MDENDPDILDPMQDRNPQISFWEYQRITLFYGGITRLFFSLVSTPSRKRSQNTTCGHVSILLESTPRKSCVKLKSLVKNRLIFESRVELAKFIHYDLGSETADAT